MQKQESNEIIYTTRYLQDVRNQPAALRDIIVGFGKGESITEKWAKAWEASGKPLIVFTGMGASLFAAEVVQAHLSEKGIFSLAIPITDLVDRLSSMPENLFLMSISQSGESIELRDLAALLGNRRLFAVTNNPESFLAELAEDTAVLHLPPDLSVAVKTYTGTLAFLMLFAAQLTEGPESNMKERLLKAADVIEEGLPVWEKEIQEWSPQLGRPRFMVFLGRGIDQYTARGASLLFKEGAKLPAESSCGGQFRHGAVEVVDDEHVSLYFVPPTSDRRYQKVNSSVGELLSLPGRVVTVGADIQEQNPHFHVSVSTDDPIVMTFAGIVPVQLLAAYLAKIGNLVAGDFRNTTPVINHDV